MKKNVQLMMLIAFLAVVSFNSCKKENEQQAQSEIPSSVQKAIAPNESSDQININILLNRQITNSILNNLQSYGFVKETFHQINALTMVTTRDNLSLIKRLSFIKDASEDVEAKAPTPIDFVPIPDFTGGINMWNLDAINVTDYNAGRTISENGEGVYIGVLDSGLPDTWEQYFPEDRIAVQYAKCFGANGSEQPNKWERDNDSHGLFVTSIILGFRNFFENGEIVNGVAPKATIIPVKVINQNNSGPHSALARGIIYMADLKTGVLANSPVIINMSLGSDEPQPITEAAIDYAISKGVIIVKSAGNQGELGMSTPTHPSLITVGSVGWKDQAITNGIFWWQTADITDPTNVQDFFVSNFSSREKAGQDLDVLAPGDWIIGPYEQNSGHLGYIFWSGTSLAAPHVTGIVALMAQKKPSLTAAEAESLLEAAAKPMGAGSCTIIDLFESEYITQTWGTDATGAGLITADAALKKVK